jgi:coenzyme F420-reducing hydrogenase alpha subunit
MTQENPKKKLDICVQNISKIEGHATVDVKVRNDEVKEVHVGFTENKRFFTQAMQKKSIHALPAAVSRVCGTCSIAHMMCSIEAIEKALGVQVSEQTMLLKKLTMHGLMIRDHALHVYLFSLPDVFGKDSVLDFDKDQIRFLKDSFAIKKAGNILDTAVAGRAVHAMYPVVGGFSKIPDNKSMRALLPALRDARERLFPVLDVYYGSNVDYIREMNFVGLVADKFDYLEGEIRSTSGMRVQEKDFYSHLKKVVMPYSQSVGYNFEGKTFMVGSLARLNLNRQGLHADTKRDAKKYLKLFPSYNVFHNNIAQAIEILHSIDHSIEIIESTDFKPELPVHAVPKECEGVGVIEAPRGTLYHHVAMDKNGIVKKGTIIVPSQQNQINMELDIKKIVQRNLHTLTSEQIEMEIEKLIRAYDPCISCASHFLKVNWA